MDGYGYIYVTQGNDGTIKRIDFYGNVSAQRTGRQRWQMRNATHTFMLAEPHNRWKRW